MKIITFKNLDVIQSDSNHANMGIPGKQEDSHEFLFQYLNRELLSAAIGNHDAFHQIASTLKQ